MIRHTRIKRVSDKRKATNGWQWSTLTAPRKPVKKRNRKRAAANLERAHGPVSRRQWIKTLRCSNCGVAGYSEGAHICNGGMSRKANADEQVPLCGPRDGIEGCHRLQHRVGWSALSRLATLTFRKIAAATIEEMWQMELRGRAGAKRMARVDKLLAELGL